MAGQELLVRTHLRMEGGAALSFDNVGSFPLSPNAGQFALVEGILYIYATLGGVNTWFPLTNKKNSHVHYQAIASTKWTVTHNYASSDLIYFAYDDQNNLLVVNADMIDNDHFELNFGTAVKGKVVVFVHSDLWVPRMETTEGFAQVLTLGQYLKVASDYVILDNSGVTVNGVNLSTWIQANEDRITLLEGVITDNGTHAQVHKDLRPSAAGTDIGDVNSRFGQAYVDGVHTEGVDIDGHTVDVVTDPVNTADADRGTVSGNVVEAHARNAASGLQPAEIKLIGTDGKTYFLRYNQGTASLDLVDELGAAVDVSAAAFVGADLVLSGSATTEDLSVNGNSVVGTDAVDTLTVNATTNFKAPVTFEGQGSLGNGDDDVTVNCGALNLFTVISQYFSLDANGLLTVKNLTVSENLDVIGTSTEANAQTVTSGDQYLTLLNTVTGTPVLDGGIKVVRGTEATASLRWDETLDAWVVGVEGDLVEIVRSDDPRLLSAGDKADLTGTGSTALHYHAADRDRTNHTGTQTASTISDFDAAVAAAPSVVALETSKVDAVAGKGLSTNDLDDTRLAKLDAALTSVSWAMITDAPDLSGAQSYPADSFTSLEVANLRSGKTAMGATMKQTLVFGGDIEPSAEEAGNGDIWFDTSGDATVVKAKNAETGQFDFVVQVASEMLMKHSNVVFVSGPADATHTFTYDDGAGNMTAPVVLKSNFLSVYLNRQLLRKDEYILVDTSTITVLVELSSGDELEVVTA